VVDVVAETVANTLANTNTAQPAMRQVPFDTFSTDGFADSDRFDAWRESISVIFDVFPADQPQRAPFNASLSAYLMPDLMVGRVAFDAQRFERTRRRIAADGLDHYLVQLYATGGLVGRAGGRDRMLHAGDIQILDLAQPSETFAKASETFAIVVPRRALEVALPSRGGVQTWVMRGDHGVGALLSDYITSMMTRLERMPARDSRLVAQVTTALIASYFGVRTEVAPPVRGEIDALTLNRVKHHIEARLADDDLAPDRLCRELRISRSALYRLFEPSAGIARYIRSRRLARAFATLTNPRHAHRRIIEVALDCGFSSDAQFSRAFRSAYGMTPREARHEGDAALMRRGSDEDAVGGRYARWIRSLGC